MKKQAKMVEHLRILKWNKVDSQRRRRKFFKKYCFLEIFHEILQYFSGFSGYIFALNSELSRWKLWTELNWSFSSAKISSVKVHFHWFRDNTAGASLAVHSCMSHGQKEPVTTLTSQGRTPSPSLRHDRLFSCIYFITFVRLNIFVNCPVIWFA